MGGGTKHGRVGGAGRSAGRVAAGTVAGVISPVAFIVSLFNSNVGIYEIDDTGGRYNFGFLLDMLMPLSGGAGAGAARPARSGVTVRHFGSALWSP